MSVCVSMHKNICLLIHAHSLMWLVLSQPHRSGAKTWSNDSLHALFLFARNKHKISLTHTDSQTPVSTQQFHAMQPL